MMDISVINDIKISIYIIDIRVYKETIMEISAMC
jgi:hypothetical protein